MGAFPGEGGTTILIRNHENRERSGEQKVVTGPVFEYNAAAFGGNTKVVVDRRRAGKHPDGSARYEYGVVRDFAILGGTSTNGAVAAELRRVVRPGGAIALAAWTPGAIRSLRGDTPRPAHRPEQWSRYETAYRHFFDLHGLDLHEATADGLDCAIVVASSFGEIVHSVHSPGSCAWHPPRSALA